MRLEEAVVRWFKFYVEWEESWGEVSIIPHGLMNDGPTLLVEPGEDYPWGQSKLFEIKGWAGEAAMPVQIGSAGSTHTFTPTNVVACDEQSKADA